MPRRAHDAGSMPRVGAVLRELREAAGLAVSEVAAICGVNRKTWYRREHLGIVPPPAELDAFARAVDPRLPLRAKTRLLAAAGILMDREAAATLVLGVTVPVLLHVLTSERKPAPAADVHRRVLERRIAESGRARGEICGEIGWEESRLLRLLDRLGPMEYEDLFTVLETIGVTREDYFQEVCRALAERERE